MEQNRDSVSGVFPGDLICALLRYELLKDSQPPSTMKQSHTASDILIALLSLKASDHIPTDETEL